MLDFFREHRGVSGAISILLTLLLLPIYSLIALLIESARYRSATDELSELTFMGEMAILADYCEFLSSDYDLYAVNEANPTGGAATFAAYVKKCQANGGADTRSLNRMLGVPVENCDIKYMYSLADPDVLNYQIKQGGRYAIPAEFISKISIEALVKALEDKFKGAKEKLEAIEEVTEKADKYTEAAENLLKMVDSGKKLYEDIKDLRKKVEEYKTAYDEFMAVKNTFPSVISPIVSANDSDYSKNYDQIFGSNGEFNRSGLGGDAASDRDFYSGANYVFGWLSSNGADHFFTGPRASDYEPPKYTIDHELKINLDKMGISGLNEGEECVYNDIYDKVAGLSMHDVSRYGFSNGTFNMGSTGELSSAASSAQSKSSELSEFSDWCGKFNNVTNSDVFTKLQTLKEKSEKLKGSYDTYADELKSLIGTIKSVAGAMGELSDMEDKAIVDQLNESNTEEHRKKYPDKDGTKWSPKDEAEKKAAQEATKKHLENYKNASEIDNFSELGSNALNSFLTKVTENELNNWKDAIFNQNQSLQDTSDVKTDSKTASDYKTSLQDFSGKDFSPYTTDRMVVKADNGFDMSDSDINSTYDQLGKVAQETSDHKDDEGHEYENEVSQDNLHKVYDFFFDYITSQGKTTDDLFAAAYDVATYYNEATILALMAFLGEAAIVDEETKGVFEFINTLLGLFENLKSSDDTLNAVVNIDDTFPTNYDVPTDLTKEQQKKAKEYQEKIVGEKFSDRSGISYYTEGGTGSNLYGLIWGGRTPGKSVEGIVTGIGGAIAAMKNFLKCVSTLRIISALIELGKLLKAIGKLVVGLINLVVDILQLTSMLVTNPVAFFSYILDQMYLSYYAKQHFSSRARSDTDIANVVDVTNINFFGAELEYILNGDGSEIANQETIYYALLVIRMLCDIGVVTSNEVVQGLTEIPYVGFIMPFLFIYVEGKLDMFFLLCGQKVAIIKDKMSVFDTETLEKLQKIVDEAFTEITETSTPSKGKSKGNLKWTMTTDEKTGHKRRVYKNDSLKKQLDKSVEDANDKTKKIKTGKKDPKTGKDIMKDKFSLDYDSYLVVLMTLYDEDTKVRRIADLIQMRCRASEGKDFKMSDCYTYIGADVEAKFTPGLPLDLNFENLKLTDDTFKLHCVQYNGY